MRKNSNLLNVQVKNYGECGWCQDEERKETLFIPWEIWSQWLFISNRMGNREWGGIFKVKDQTITEFRIPKQAVNSAECEFKEELGGEGLVHSHHNMQAFHSSQDDAHARNLYEYSIVLSNTNGYEATKKIRLPCGGFGYLRVELSLLGCPEVNLSMISLKTQEVMKEVPPALDELPGIDWEERYPEGGEFV